jgi:hypothetical protein
LAASNVLRQLPNRPVNGYFHKPARHPRRYHQIFGFLPAAKPFQLNDVLDCSEIQTAILHPHQVRITFSALVSAFELRIEAEASKWRASHWILKKKNPFFWGLVAKQGN